MFFTHTLHVCHGILMMDNATEILVTAETWYNTIKDDGKVPVQHYSLDVFYWSLLF